MIVRAKKLFYKILFIIFFSLDINNITRKRNLKKKGKLKKIEKEQQKIKNLLQKKTKKNYLLVLWLQLNYIFSNLPYFYFGFC